jgi:hydrogenase expression/formation protein HypE
VISESSEDQVGKIAPDVFRRAIFPHLGAERDDVVVGPQHGVDAGIIRLGGGQVLAVTTDPFYVQPHLGWERAAWFGVNIVASDAATTGLAPSHLSVDLNLPLTMPDGDLERLWLGVHEACREIGLAVVAGHTGRYERCDFPMLGGATILALGHEDAYVTPAMARPGDAILITKGVAIESACLLALSFPGFLSSQLGEAVVTATQKRFRQLSVVCDARIAAGAGIRKRGVTSMHDATERGLFGGLHEIAQASGVGMVVDRDAIDIPSDVRAICDLLDMNPYDASSEGTLILTCVARDAAEVMDRLQSGGIGAHRIGEVVPPDQGMHLVVDGREQTLPLPSEDAFWPAYVAARAGAEP